MTGPDERAPGDPEWRFGTYRLLPASRLLFDADRAVRLGSRAFDILGLLVERAGEVVSHKEIFARAWGTTIVNEANIRAKIAGLRKVLAGGHNNQSLIANISGRGYQFVAPVMRGQSALRNSSAPSKLPALLARLFGRAEAITTVRAWLRSERLVTIVGPGGIGKTTLALAVAQEFATDQSWFVDVASVSDEAGVPAVLASSMGLP